jgi:hypothetical protein
MCHIYEYSVWELKELVKSEGFEIISINTWNSYDSDPGPIRVFMLQILFAKSLMSLGYIKEGLLFFKPRGHQIGLLARKL